MQLLQNGAASFFCSKHVPLTFGVEISYDVSQVNHPHPPMRVTWLVDDKISATSMWKQQGLFVLADSATSADVATAVLHAKSFVGIKAGRLTSLFDVKGLAEGLKKLKRACG